MDNKTREIITNNLKHYDINDYVINDYIEFLNSLNIGDNELLKLIRFNENIITHAFMNKMFKQPNTNVR